MSNQEVADSRVLRNSLTSLSPFPFKVYCERIIDFDFLAFTEFSDKKVCLYAGWGAMQWGLGTGKTAKQTLKLPNKLPDKSSSQTLSRQE